MKTRKQAEARANELCPDRSEVFGLVDRAFYAGFLQCWDEMQQDKHTCGFCVEPKQHQNDDGVYDDLSDVINNVNTDSAINMGRTLSISDYNPRGYSVEDWKENAKEDYMRTPISVLKYITVLEEQLGQCDQLREAAEDVVQGYKDAIPNFFMLQRIEDLEKALR